MRHYPGIVLIPGMSAFTANKKSRGHSRVTLTPKNSFTRSTKVLGFSSSPVGAGVAEFAEAEQATRDGTAGGRLADGRVDVVAGASEARSHASR